MRPVSRAKLKNLSPVSAITLSRSTETYDEHSQAFKIINSEKFYSDRLLSGVLLKFACMQPFDGARNI